MNELEVFFTRGDIEYWGLYEFGSEFSDAPEEREYPIVSLLKCGASTTTESEGECPPTDLPEGVLDALDERALMAAAESLDLPY